jgi:Skp family chaperone for outer membrane proteins
MKRILTISQTFIIAFIALAGFQAASVGGVSAQQLKPAVIAVIDSRRLFSESLVSKDIRQQLTSISQTFAAEENKVKEELLAEKQQIDSQKSLMAQEAYEDKYAQLKARADQLNRKADIHQKQLNVAQVRANRELQRVLTPIIQKVSEKRGATIVLEKAQIVHQQAGLDITTEVVESLDRELPTLKVELPSEAEILEMERQARSGEGQ